MSDILSIWDRSVKDGDAGRYEAPRDGDRPLRFTGTLLGEGTHGTGGNSGYSCDWTRGVVVQIWRTARGKHIVATRHWSRWQGEHTAYSAQVCADAEAVLCALRDDEGRLRTAEAEALEKAAIADEGLRAVSVEEID